MSKTVILHGRKVGMTHTYSETGANIPVTVVELDSAKVIRHKTEAKDGYSAAVLAGGERKRSRLNKPEQGLAKAYELEAFACIYELQSQGLPDVGALLSTEWLSVDTPIDVTSTSKGKGFAGTVKRYNFRMQDATHGNSRSHRVPGSTGSIDAGRVKRGKKMPGHMGDCRVTLKRRSIVSIDVGRSLVSIKGPVPGPNGGKVIVSQNIE